MNILDNKKLLLVLGSLLVVIGLLKPNLSTIWTPSNTNTIITNDLQYEKPATPETKEACDKVVDIIINGPSSRKADGLKLASLYCDLANLISLDGENQVIKSTLEIREANKLAGLLSHINIKDKYDGLSEAANGVIVVSIGDDDAILDQALRAKSVTAFRNLAWACAQGAK